jgi:hypothetical protein
LSREDDVLEILLRGLPEEEVSSVREGSQALQLQMSDAIDIIRGILADREGRDALAKAIRKGVING